VLVSEQLAAENVSTRHDNYDLGYSSLKVVTDKLPTVHWGKSLKLTCALMDNAQENSSICVISNLKYFIVARDRHDWP
jgi:hypothetical protein